MPQERISKDYFLNPLRAQKIRITMNPTFLPLLAAVVGREDNKNNSDDIVDNKTKMTLSYRH